MAAVFSIGICKTELIITFYVFICTEAGPMYDISPSPLPGDC